MTEIEKISTKKIFVHIWTKNSVKNLTKWIFLTFLFRIVYLLDNIMGYGGENGCL